MRAIFSLSLTASIKVKGAYGEITTTHLYSIAGSFEEALEQCRQKYPEARVKQISNIDYYNGLPLLGLED